MNLFPGEDREFIPGIIALRRFFRITQNNRRDCLVLLGDSQFLLNILAVEKRSGKANPTSSQTFGIELDKDSEIIYELNSEFRTQDFYKGATVLL